MAKKSQTKKTTARKVSRKDFWKTPKGKKTAIVLLAAVALLSIAVILYFSPLRTPGAKNGVGANGFSVFEIKGANLGIADVAKKDIVVKELGSYVKSVDDVESSGVLNFNGNKGQTATYYIETKDGTQGSVYVDLLEYKSDAALKADNLTKGTADGGKVQDLPVRYMHAATIANEREYALLITKGLKSYKFAMTQPFRNITINEVTALGLLKKIAEKSSL